jgi:RNA polymerase sigma-70 factor (ECF subfamily)
VTDGDVDRIEPLATGTRTGVGLRAASTAGASFVLEAYDTHQRDLYGFVRALVRDPELAEDVVADTFVKLLGEYRAGRPPIEVRAWLFRVAANLVVNSGRRRAVAGRYLHRLVRRGHEEAADARLLRSERTEELVSALAGMPADHRTALLLAAHGFSGREIAVAIDRSEVAVRTLLSRARVRLRERLEPKEVER